MFISPVSLVSFLTSFLRSSVLFCHHHLLIILFDEINMSTRGHAERKFRDTVFVGYCKISHVDYVHPNQYIRSGKVAFCNVNALKGNMVR